MAGASEPNERSLVFRFELRVQTEGLQASL
jgi:hypothetical protein